MDVPAFVPSASVIEIVLVVSSTVAVSAFPVRSPMMSALIVSGRSRLMLSVPSNSDAVPAWVPSVTEMLLPVWSFVALEAFPVNEALIVLGSFSFPLDDPSKVTEVPSLVSSASEIAIVLGV